MSLIAKPFILLEKSAVPVFMMLAFYYSTYKLDEGNIEWIKERLKRLMIPFMVWNLIYCLAVSVVRGNVTVRDLLAQFYWALLNVLCLLFDILLI